MGECCLVHYGAGRWIVIDSVKDHSTGESVALSYLRSMGIEPSSAIKKVIATHWHDDHIGGLCSILRTCGDARFCTSVAMTNSEFLVSVLPFGERNKISEGSGIDELKEILNLLESKAVIPEKAIENKRLFYESPQQSKIGQECEIWTLSPSDLRVQKFLEDILELIPSLRETKRRAPTNNKNHFSIVTYVRVGDASLLLGGDLEETADPRLGWTAIVKSEGRPKAKSALYKVPHHGSETAHCASVWSEMLITDPVALIAPYSRSQLPRESDIHRIVSLTPHAYITAPPKSARSGATYPKTVQKTIQEAGVSLQGLNEKFGYVRVRNRGAADPTKWDVEIRAPARGL